MPETTAREAKLIQYLNEAYGKEKQLVTTLQAQIKLAAPRPVIQNRLKEHLKETREQAKGLERRIKQLGGKADASSIPGPDVVGRAVAGAANQALAAAKGPIQALRGTSQPDNLLRNMRDAFWNEAEEIAHYNVIEALAEQLGDRDTVKLAREFRRQEERVQAFLEKQLKALVKDVIKEEIPREERTPAAASSSRSTSRSSSRSSSRAGSNGGRSSGAKSGGGRSSAAKPAATKSSASKPTASKSTASKPSASKSTARKSAASKPAAARSRSTASKSTGTKTRSSRAKASSSSSSGNGGSGGSGGSSS